MNKHSLSYRFLNGNVHGCVFAKNRPVSLNWPDYTDPHREPIRPLASPLTPPPLPPRRNFLDPPMLIYIVDMPGPEVIKLFPYSTQLIMKFILLINVKMPTTVGILTFISMINTTSKNHKVRTFFVCRYFSFDNLGPWAQEQNTF